MKLEELREYASTIVASGVLNTAKMRLNEDQVLALLIFGDELGFRPMESCRALKWMNGRPTLTADAIAALVFRKYPDAVFDVVEDTPERVTVAAARPGREPKNFSFSMDDAKQADLLTNPLYKKYPRDMLRARCRSRSGRAVFPDVFFGVYSPEEVATFEDKPAEAREDGVGSSEDPREDDVEIQPWLDRVYGCETLPDLGDVVMESEKQSLAQRVPYEEFSKFSKAHKLHGKMLEFAEEHSLESVDDAYLVRQRLLDRGYKQVTKKLLVSELAAYRQELMEKLELPREREPGEEG